MLHRAAVLLVVGAALFLSACDTRPVRKPRRRGAQADDPTDTTIPMDVRIAFNPPATWERVSLPAGLEFRQPPGFALVNAPAITCDANTPPADSGVLRTDLSDRWPLTLAMRRGDLARIARANGFTIDSTDVAMHGQQPGDTTVVKRGEGWMLLDGRSRTRALLATVRAPNGCYLLWAARGTAINIDTLGFVLGTVHFRPTAPVAP